MKGKYLVAISIVIASMIVTFAPEIDSAIPPTPAIKTITSNDTTYTTIGGTYEADSSSANLWIITDGSILVEFINYTGGVQ